MLTVSSGDFRILWQGDRDSPCDANDFHASSTFKYNGKTETVDNGRLLYQIWQINLKGKKYMAEHYQRSLLWSWITCLSRTLKWQAKARVLKETSWREFSENTGQNILQLENGTNWMNLNVWMSIKPSKWQVEIKTSPLKIKGTKQSKDRVGGRTTLNGLPLHNFSSLHRRHFSTTTHIFKM